MDNTAAVAQAIVLAGTVGAFLSMAQERFLGGRLSGTSAMAFNVAASLAIGIVAVLQSGGFVLTVTEGDTFATALSVLANAGLVLAASQVAFRIIVRPVTPIGVAEAAIDNITP
jgi:hypothetical protein